MLFLKKKHFNRKWVWMWIIGNIQRCSTQPAAEMLIVDDDSISQWNTNWDTPRTQNLWWNHLYIALVSFSCHHLHMETSHALLFCRCGIYHWGSSKCRSSWFKAARTRGHHLIHHDVHRVPNYYYQATHHCMAYQQLIYGVATNPNTVSRHSDK